jgi:hypothetical protein
MLHTLKLRDDSLLHWCVAPLFSWTVFGILVGIPIHIAFGISVSSIALFFAIQCALQIAVTPWLFAARATAGNPRGQRRRRTQVVIVWGALACEAAFLQMFGGNFADKTAVTIFLGGPIVLGSMSLIALHWFQKRVETKES